MKKILVDIEETRFGNHLYFYLFASRNNDTYVQYEKDMEYWNQFFPRLNEFGYKKNEYDEKVKKISPNASYFQRYGKDFSGSELKCFIENYLKDDLMSLIQEKSESFDCVFNIRRGDFYDDYFLYLYGFDQISYIKNTLTLLNLPDNVRVAVISDDIHWCEENLSFLKTRVKGVRFIKCSPIDAFLECVKAKKLVITNSTFSYWAAYLNTFLNPNHSIYAPNYNTMQVKFGKQIAAAENWNIIPVVPYRSLKSDTKFFLKRVKNRTLKGLRYFNVFKKE
ncbi:TPA: alpha-1,2-fucosyltransferase [Streptococcus suis]|nr:alpha-1,2-fucosyltransferase [Streptococcus suis]